MLKKLLFPHRYRDRFSDYDPQSRGQSEGHAAETRGFGTAPLFLLTTDLPENDHLAQTISHRLYDSHESARIAQSSLLGYGGARLLEILNRETEIYHLNEGHALPLCFFLWDKYKSLEEVKKRVVFTTHTPEIAGNEEHDASRLEVMSFSMVFQRETTNL